MSEKLIVAENLFREYALGEQRIRALDDVSFNIQPGEFIVLLGRSGSGKSTLLNMLGGLDRVDRGSLAVNGYELNQCSEKELSRYRQSSVGFIFQSFNLISGMTAWENISMPLIFKGVSPVVRKEKAFELLEKVGLKNRAHNRPHQLSGGEQQRVAVARAMINDPKLLLCDEPTGNLDSTTSADIMGLIDELNKEGHTIVVVTHDSALAKTHASRIFEMNDGCLKEVVLP